MHVAMYYSNKDIRLEDMPVPTIGEDEILMRVEASGICGSDIMEWYRRDKVPLVLGHEVSGTVHQVGAKVINFKRGMRIVTTHHVPCGECEYCRNGHATVCDTLRKTHFYPGGFAEFIRIPAINVSVGTFPLADHVSFAEGSFVEPLGCVLRGQRLAGMNTGKNVLIIGSGISGMIHIKAAKHLGAKTIVATDVDEYRLKKAGEFGANRTFHAQNDFTAQLRQMNGGRLADIVILCSGAMPAIQQGLESVERGGVVLFFTAATQGALLPFSINSIFWRTELTLMSSYAASPADLKEALDLITSRKIIVSDMITHCLPLQETQRGFQLVAVPNNSIKVIIEPQK